MPDLVHCIYTSVATRPLDPEKMDALVRRSRDSNRASRITGVLLRVGETFFQVLEGPREEIDALYGRILEDPRHTRVTRIIYESIARRFFEDTSMSLATLSPEELSAALEEQSGERTETLLAGLDEGRAKRLIRAFSQGRWQGRLEHERQEQGRLEPERMEPEHLEPERMEPEHLEPERMERQSVA